MLCRCWYIFYMKHMFSDQSLSGSSLLFQSTSSKIGHVSQVAPSLGSLMIPCLSLYDKISWRETSLKVTARKCFRVRVLFISTSLFSLSIFLVFAKKCVDFKSLFGCLVPCFATKCHWVSFRRDYKLCKSSLNVGNGQRLIEIQRFQKGKKKLSAGVDGNTVFRQILMPLVMMDHSRMVQESIWHLHRREETRMEVWQINIGPEQS
jgi:hypothetical protein